MSHVLHLGDCLEGMAGLADKSVDHVITDPPYEAEAHSRGRRQGAPGGGLMVKEIAYPPIGAEDRMAAATQIARVARRWILVFCQSEAIHKWSAALLAGGAKPIRNGVYRKLDAQPQYSGDRPGVGWEAIVIALAGDGPSRWNAGGKCAIWEATREGRFGVSAPHDGAKPLELMEQLVRDFTDPGELVCDPFAGSGTTGVACKRLGRNFIGWEKDPKFHAAAVKRIEAAREQFQLPRLPKAKQTGMVLHAPGAEAVDAQTKAQP